MNTDRKILNETLANSAIYTKRNTPSASGIYCRNARQVQYLKINQSKDENYIIVSIDVYKGFTFHDKKKDVTSYFKKKYVCICIYIHTILTHIYIKQ